MPIDSPYADTVLPCRVSPFGYLRINAHLQLPEAFRSLSRPSSAPDAKAFPLRPYQLDLFKPCPFPQAQLASELPQIVLCGSLISFRIMQTHLFYQQNCNYPFRRSKLRSFRFRLPLTSPPQTSYHFVAPPLKFKSTSLGFEFAKTNKFKLLESTGQNVSLLLPSHNLHHFFSMFSFQGTS